MGGDRQEEGRTPGPRRGSRVSRGWQLRGIPQVSETGRRPLPPDGQRGHLSSSFTSPRSRVRHCRLKGCRERGSGLGSRMTSALTTV